MALTEVIGITVFKTIRIPLSRKLFSVKETNMFFPLHLGTFDLSHQSVVDWMESDKYKMLTNMCVFARFIVTLLKTHWYLHFTHIHWKPSVPGVLRSNGSKYNDNWNGHTHTHKHTHTHTHTLSVSISCRGKKGKIGNCGRNGFEKEHLPPAHKCGYLTKVLVSPLFRLSLGACRISRISQIQLHR